MRRGRRSLGGAGRHGLGPGRTSPALGDNGMSQPSRPRGRGPAQQRRRRDLKLDRPVPLEERRMPAPGRGCVPADDDVHGAGDADQHRPRHGDRVGEYDGGDHRQCRADHLGGGTDAELVVRRRYRQYHAGPRRRLRLGRLRHLPRGRRQHRRDQPARHDLSRRSGHGQGQRVLRPEHGPQPDRPQQHLDLVARGQLVGRIDRAGELVQHDLRPRGHVRRHALAVRQQRRPLRSRARTSSTRSRPAARSSASSSS